MQSETDRVEVGRFNANAPALESDVVNGVEYEVFHDFYHNRTVVMRYGNDTFRSVGFRIKGKPESFNFSSHAFFKRSCKSRKALALWMNAMRAKYGDNALEEVD